MTTEPMHDPDGVPHVLIGIGAVVLVLLCAMLLVVLSGHASRTLILVLGAPVLLALIVAAFHRRRHED